MFSTRMFTAKVTPKNVSDKKARKIETDKYLTKFFLFPSLKWGRKFDYSDALESAIRDGKINIVRGLFDRGVDINHIEDIGEYNDDIPPTPLILASIYGHVEIIKFLLKQPTIQLNNVSGYDHYTALMWAIDKGHVEVVRLLLEHPEIDVNKKNEHGGTALMVASREGHLEIVRLLLEHPRIDINIENDDGDTALMLASRGGHNDIVKLIDAYDKIIKLKDLGGVNALDNLTGKKLPLDVFSHIAKFLTGKKGNREDQRNTLIQNIKNLNMSDIVKFLTRKKGNREGQRKNLIQNLKNLNNTAGARRTRKKTKFSKPASINAPPPITPSDGPILPEDILFQDSDVCVLKPNVKKGVLIFTKYTQPTGMPPLCEAGLKTGAQLQTEGVNFGRSMIHDYMFFRAPYYSDPIDYTSIDTEIASSFGIGESTIPSRVWIRIDPEKTNVYSSEIRAEYSPEFRYGSEEYLSAMENQVKKSKKSMTNYLRILDKNKTAITDIEPGKKPFYNLLSSEVRLFPIAYNLKFPWNSDNINTNSEVLVRIPHLTPNYFVKCS